MEVALLSASLFNQYATIQYWLSLQIAILELHAIRSSTAVTQDDPHYAYLHTDMNTSNENNLAPIANMSAKGGNNIPIARPQSTRRVLGDVSPNVKPDAATPMFLKKTIAGSPLKRSYTAAHGESGKGWMYLKKRRLGENEVLSQVAEGPREGTALKQIVVVDLDKAEDDAPLSPTEPNTPSEEDENTSSSSAEERKSFSSLINYDQSSQTSNFAFRGISNADLLRLRLRVAMYKIRTNQIGTPFSDLKVADQPTLTPTQLAVEEAVAQLRREAQEVVARRPQSHITAKLLPAPVLRPTAYSSRMIHELALPSSPPASLSPDKLPTAAQLETPLKDLRRWERSPSKELTSSVVKGRVAEGLLGLRHAV